MARPTRALLSRDIIGRAAIELVEAGHDLQMQPLAERLGVRVSSLYHHVAGRAGVIHAMRAVLSERYRFTPPQAERWQDTVRGALGQFLRMYADHPRVLQLMVTVVIDEPNVLELYEVLVAALRTAGVPENELLVTVETLDAFIFGVALDRLSPDQLIEPRDPGLRDLVARHRTGAARNEQLFEHGLSLLLAGIRARVESARSG